MTEKDVHYARSLGCLHDLSPTEWEKTLCDYQTISFGTGHQRRVRFSRRWCPEDQFPFGYMIISCVHALVSSFGSLTPHLWWSTNIGFSWTFTILGSSSQKHSICGSNQWFALMLLKKNKLKSTSYISTLLLGSLSQARYSEPLRTGRLLLRLSAHHVTHLSCPCPRARASLIIDCPSSPPAPSSFYLSDQEAFWDFIISKCTIMNKKL